MRNHSRCRTALRHIVGLVLGASLTASAAFGIPVVAVQPSPVNVTAGEVFSLDVAISGVTDLYAFQFDLGFDPTKLQSLSVMEGPFLGGGGVTFFIPGTADNTLGSVEATFDSLIGAINGVDGGGVLASFSFRALAAGQSTVTPGNITLLDSFFFDIPSTPQAGMVAAGGEVPEPSALSAFAGFLCLLAAVAARRGRRGAWLPTLRPPG